MTQKIKANERCADHRGMRQDIRFIRQVIVIVVVLAIFGGLVFAVTRPSVANDQQLQSIVCAQDGAETDPDCQ